MKIDNRSTTVNRAAAHLTASNVFVCLLALWLAAGAVAVSGQTLDTFNPNANGYTVYALAAQPDGKIVVAGFLTDIGGVARSRVARFNADGALDASFNPNINDTVFTLAVQPDGKIIAGGFFETVGGFSRGNLVRLNADGTVDRSFSPNPNSLVYAAALQPDGKILIGGAFTQIGDATRSRIARLNADGTVDDSFNPSADSAISSFAVQPDGKIIIAGSSLNSVNGQSRGRVARLNPDGTLDDTFIDPVISGTIYTVFAQPDGKILIGGIDTNNKVGDQPRTGLFRLNSNGTLDIGFNPVLTSSLGNIFVFTFSMQTDGKILASGSFDVVNGKPRNNIARFNPNGSLDESFGNTVFSDYSSVHHLLQADGKIALGGSFSTVNGQTRNLLARLTNTAAPAQSLNITPSSIFWTRSGTGPELSRVTFESSPDGANYSFLGNAMRVGATSNWILNGLNLPVGQNVIVRARGYYQTGYFNASGSILETTQTVKLNSRAQFDFDGDGKADVSVFRPADTYWYALRSASGFSATQWGLANDKLAPADYDGDGKTDVAVFRNGVWYILQSANSTFRAVTFGAAGDTPLPADFDADKRADLCFFRPSNGTWYTFNLTTNQAQSVRWGISTDKPVAGDFDGDGRADFTVFRDGVWYSLRNGFNGVAYINYGLPTDKPVAADYDGDGVTDVAVFRNGTWYYQSSAIGGQSQAFQFGQAGDIPVAADYDGDGKADFAVFRNGTWFLQQSTADFSAVQFGLATDKPIPAAYNP